MKKRIAVVFLVSALLSAAAAGPAAAGTRTLLPAQFTTATWSLPLSMIDSNVRRNFHWLGSVAAGVAVYECEVRLPVGATITKVAVNAEAVQPVEVWLGRAKLGGPDETVATFEASGSRGWYSTTGIDLPRVAAGYRYWVHLDVVGSDAFVYGVQVSYR